MAGQDTDFEFPVELSREDEIEPGSPRLENVLFVVLGAACAVAVILHLALLFGGFG